MNKHYGLHLLELGIIISLFAYVVLFGKAEVQSSMTLVTSFDEPPSLSSEPNDLQDIENDLKSLGCKIIYLTDSSVSNGFIVKNYTEFRRSAYNSKIVFLRYIIGYPTDGVKLYTIFNGVIIEYGQQLQK